MTQVIQNVSDTAFMVAGFRAAENERPNPLFRDPLAARLAGDHGENILATMPTAFIGAWSVVIRTVIIDNLISQAIAEGVDTILNLGAGLDTRPYRMALPKTLRWVEVDYPHVIALKEERLAGEEPRCRLEAHRARPHRPRRSPALPGRYERRGHQGPGAHRGGRSLFDRDRRRRSCRRSQGGREDSLLDRRLLSRPRRFATAKRCAPASCAMRHFGSSPRIGSAFSQATAGARARCVICLMRRDGLAGRFRCLGSGGCG